MSKFKSNKLRLIPLVDGLIDDCGNDVRRSVLEIVFWLAGNKNSTNFINTFFTISL